MNSAFHIKNIILLMVTNGRKGPSPFGWASENTTGVLTSCSVDVAYKLHKHMSYFGRTMVTF